MIRFALALFILASGYYTFTYGKSLWVDDHNKLGGIGAVLAAMMSTVLPILYMLWKI